MRYSSTPQSTYTGNMTLTLYNQADVTGTISIDGSTVAPTLTVPGQRARYTFGGTAGQLLNLGVSGVSITNSNVSILKPDGTTLALATIGTGGGSVDPAALPVTGTYTVVVDPWNVYTGSMTLTLSSALAGSITLDGASVSVSLTRVGQTGRYTFSGTAGQQVNIGVSSVTITTANVSLLRPDNTTLASASIGATGGSVDPSILPTTGTYTILVDPSGTYTGSATLTLSTEITGSLTINAAAIPVTITRAGQNGRYTLAGTAGQLVTVRITGNTFLGLTTIRLLRQNGTYLTYNWSSAASFSLSQTSLPATETYTVVIDPSAAATGVLNLQVTNP
jgi:hypothetical protein